MKNEQKPNYQMIFIMGITFTGAGIAIGNPGIMGLGLCLMAIGLAKRSQWPNKKHPDKDA